jgi:membrane protein DedA with SNARE-associated domain
MEKYMLENLENLILDTLNTVFDQFGWAGVFGLMIFENATGITPSELILTFAGWMLIAAHNLNPASILVGGLIAAVGSTIGASLTYWAARLGGRPLVYRVGRWLHIDITQIDRVEGQFQHWGTGLVFVGRVIPGVRTLVNIPAGLARMPYSTFLAATFFGTFIWCSLLIGAGYILGHEWRLISQYIKQWLPFIVSGAILVILLITYWRFSPKLALSAVRSESNLEEKE